MMAMECQRDGFQMKIFIELELLNGIFGLLTAYVPIFDCVTVDV